MKYENAKMYRQPFILSEAEKRFCQVLSAFKGYYPPVSMNPPSIDPPTRALAS